MIRERKTFTWMTVVAIACGAAAVGVLINMWLLHSPIQPLSLAGAVLRQDTDPKKQSPIANTKITAAGGLSSGSAKSDSSGHFHLTLRPGVPPGQPVTLKFEHGQYKPLEITEIPKDQLYIVRMEPIVREPLTKPNHPETPVKQVQIKDVRVRYSVKSQTTINVGSIAKEFEVANAGNVPCKGHRPCSPDGKWKAATGSLSLDAQEGNEFRNVRVSCIAGPCPFTRIEPDDLSSRDIAQNGLASGGQVRRVPHSSGAAASGLRASPARRIKISVLNWSDTAVFLVEAEVTRTMVTDTIRRLYPFLTGQTMSFALPAAAEGPSVEADLNGEEIVFPLGPKLILSWATCSVEIAPDRNKIYRCELKPGYQFQQ